jgi:hypothetical protein
MERILSSQLRVGDLFQCLDSGSQELSKSMQLLLTRRVLPDETIEWAVGQKAEYLNGETLSTWQMMNMSVFVLTTQEFDAEMEMEIAGVTNLMNPTRLTNISHVENTANPHIPD